MFHKSSFVNIMCTISIYYLTEQATHFFTLKTIILRQRLLKIKTAHNVHRIFHIRFEHSVSTIKSSYVQPKWLSGPKSVSLS